MRTDARCVLAVVGVAAAVVVAPAGVSLAAANQPQGLAIASVLPTNGQIGRAHV